VISQTAVVLRAAVTREMEVATTMGVPPLMMTTLVLVVGAIETAKMTTKTMTMTTRQQ
jgi:hypothetical protein